MQKSSIYLIIGLIIFVVCIGVFWFQYNNDVATIMILNETQVTDGQSFKGQLLDSYGLGVANKTLSYQKPNLQIVDVVTDENGEFFVENDDYLPDDKNNYYGNFTFKGDGKYLGCTYEGKVEVIN